MCAWLSCEICGPVVLAGRVTIAPGLVSAMNGVTDRVL